MQTAQYCANQPLGQPGTHKHFGISNPFGLTDLQDVQEITSLRTPGV